MKQVPTHPGMKQSQAVSIITCTKRPSFLHNLFQNYGRQTYRNKELIVILNNRTMNFTDYIEAAKPYKNVRIYRLPDNVSLGACLNYGVKRSRFGYIAKFDDDDYYAPDYLGDSMRTMLKTNADIVGKRAHYMYLQSKKLLLLRYSDLEQRPVHMVQGATLLVKRQVFQQISFPNQTGGECIRFCTASLARGFRIYAGSKLHFIAIRRNNSRHHTWIVSDKQLTRNAKVLKVENI
ncbi:glycosyltransferase [Risungbinella massiliensis]|uniref:glycosyltransferase n=1 Tax=Risungbinella massiliensis TaxID=1329796 RepID=UPI0005CB8186|nr:glycosyltransferase [Risungbinella massiliensis]